MDIARYFKVIPLVLLELILVGPLKGRLQVAYGQVDQSGSKLIKVAGIIGGLEVKSWQAGTMLKIEMGNWAAGWKI
jgi:hypothetical protein